ncbi:MAG: ABC transporter substrate-binding protein [Oscillospiraceae bacterium]|nr:ABC transporter substrate-binding protein [Oscillospiraceae bacterium]
MKKRSLVRAIAIMLSAAMLGMTSCGSGSQRAENDNVIKIGYINPTTGSLAGNGEGCDWIVDRINDYVKENPITVDGQMMDFEIIVYDSESDANKCSELAQKLIEEDNVDLIVAIQTPNTVIPVVEVAERYEVPCIATQAPVDPVSASRETFNWTFLSFYTLDDVYESQRALWTAAGYAPGSGSRIGLLFANDADGTAWHELFVRRLAEDGYTVVDPGQYPSGTTDFTNLANTFKKEGIDVIAGTNIPPDFMNSYNAVISAGVEAGAVTMGKCCLLESDVNALGDLADGIMTQVWWAPTNPFTSSLTGVSSPDLDAAYARDNGGRTMPQPAAYGYQALELAVHTFRTAKSMNKEDIRDAVAALDTDTIIGHVKYDQKMNGLTFARTVLCGGQWQREDGELKLRIIDNSLHTDIPLTGKYIEGNATNKK